MSVSVCCYKKVLSNSKPAPSPFPFPQGWALWAVGGGRGRVEMGQGLNKSCSMSEEASP